MDLAFATVSSDETKFASNQIFKDLRVYRPIAAHPKAKIRQRTVHTGLESRFGHNQLPRIAFTTPIRTADNIASRKTLLLPGAIGSLKELLQKGGDSGTARVTDV